jgi:hypothetical protein
MDQPITPIVKMTYIGSEIATAGVGLMLQTVMTCGTNAEEVHIPESIPKISIRFMTILSILSAQKVAKPLLDCN